MLGAGLHQGIPDPFGLVAVEINLIAVFAGVARATDAHIRHAAEGAEARLVVADGRDVEIFYHRLQGGHGPLPLERQHG